MVSKRHIYQSKHPFGVHPFEALSDSSWKAIESIGIKYGTMTLNFVDKQCTFYEKVPFTNIRVKSRQATLVDCTCFLRPGVDVCILSNPQHTEHSSDEEKKDPVRVTMIWLDGRISSIARKPHESGCSCEFYINFYTNQGGLGSVRETLSKELTAVRIDQISILQRLGQNSCEDQYYRWDLSEDSNMRQKTKLLLGKFLADVTWLLVTSALKKSPFIVKSVQNKLAYQIVEGFERISSSSSCENLQSVSFRLEKGVLVPVVVEFVPDDSPEDPTSDKVESGPSPYSDTMGLRRSKRRNIQPERFLGCDSGSEIDIGYVRARPIKVDRFQDDDLHVPLSVLFGVDGIGSVPRIDTTKDSKPHKRKLVEDLGESKTKSKKTKSDTSKHYERKPQLATASFPEQNDPLAFEYYRVKSRSHKDREQDLDEIHPQYFYPNSSSKTQSNGGYGYEDFELQTKWSTRPFNKRPVTAPRKKYYYPKYNSAGERTYQKRSLHAGAYTELINAFLKNIDCNSKEQPDISTQWKESMKPKSSNPSRETELPPEEDVEEISETEMLWQECELALASLYVQDGNEGSNGNGGKVSEEDCRHEHVVDDELGILCDICGAVITGIRDVVPPFAQNTIWYSNSKSSKHEDSDHGPDNAANMDYTYPGAPDEPLPEDKENVWALIPEIKRKLHLHQKKAFEFLWQNIAGSLKPDMMESVSEKKTGGCVISHTPGAGKTFLIIAFLVSYLKLFPGKRPLILAPKTTLYTWYKEFIKWKIPVPVYLIHGRRSYRVFRQSYVNLPGGPKPTDDVRHILDCLEKIQKWHSHPSVLVMGYTSFLSLMRENSKFEHRKFMAKVLRESPGLLVLDEGHNPRSTKSRLRKALMKVETELRILLSGTVFQNNFCEYFNTLCLARPKFVDEVLNSLDPKYRKKKKELAEKARTLMEARARKFFLDIIARKIDSNEGQDRKKGLNMLKKITNRFIDVYESGGSDSLPGLQIYTMLMNSTDTQHDILVKLHRIMSNYKGYPLELELLITLGSIHPWLVKTSLCASKFFTEDELLGLEKYKYELKKGSKVKFVLNLVYRVVKTEKILIFCHNIAPVKLFMELFERVFGWQKGREVLALTGDLELFDRGRVMDKFEEAGGPSRVLLASITACAEGISLTAASRVIMLDSEWNPSKTKQAIARAFRPGQQKVVYVYQLLATGTLEEDKYRRTTWKEWVSSMIFSEDFVEDPSKWQAEKIEDDVLREMVAEDKTKSFHMIMKNEKASTVIRSKD